MKHSLILVGLLLSSCAGRVNDHASHEEAARSLAAIIPPTTMWFVGTFACADDREVRTLSSGTALQVLLPDGRRLQLPVTGDRTYSDGGNAAAFVPDGLELTLAGETAVRCEERESDLDREW